MLVKQIWTESLGHPAYLVGCQERGVCAVVDPWRDVVQYLCEALALMATTAPGWISYRTD